MTVTPDERTAARQYLVHDHASVTLKGQAGEEANRHAEEIDDKHPRARDIALTGTARELGKLPPHLARHQRESRQQAGISTEQATRIRNAYRAPEPPAGHPHTPAPAPARSPARSSSRRAGGGGSSYGTDLISSATSSSWGQTITQMFTWGIGLSIGYVLINKAGAASGLVTGITNFVRNLVSVKVDPLNPHSAVPRPVPGPIQTALAGVNPATLNRQLNVPRVAPRPAAQPAKSNPHGTGNILAGTH